MWRLDTELKDYLPDWYRNILELSEICDTEKKQFDLLVEELNAVADNFFFGEMDLPTIEQWEKLFNIIANPTTESFSFRETRLKNRMTMQPPYTIRFLRKKLDELLGAGAYTVYCDYPNYTLHIESSSNNMSDYTELVYTVNRLKPAHIIFQNKPVDNTQIDMRASAFFKRYRWNYRLGSWAFDNMTPFRSEEDGGLQANMRITDDFIEQTATKVLDIPVAAVINNSARIAPLETTVEDGDAVFRFAITHAEASAVEHIKLVDSNNTVLMEQSIYIPVSASSPVSVTIKISIRALNL